MTGSIYVHPRVHERHPEIDDDDVIAAWRSCLKSVPRLDRNPDEYVAVGVDGHNRLVEMIARRLSDGSFLVFHAFTPPTRKVLVELDLFDRR